MVYKKIKINGHEMPVREFKFEWFTFNPSICIIAKRGSGKSVLCKEILKYYDYIPGGVIISQTESVNSFYGHFFPDLYIYHEYDPRILTKIIKRQRESVKKCREKFEKGKKFDPRIFLLMDDCLASKRSWATDPLIAEIFYNGRHLQIMFILTMQFPLGIRPELRSNFDYIFLLAEDFVSNKKRLYEHYAGMFPSFDIFRQAFDQMTDEFGIMVIVNRGARKNFLDKIFWYKARKDLDIKKNKLGCKQFIEYNDNNYNKNWENQKDDRFNIQNYGPRRGRSY